MKFTAALLSLSALALSTVSAQSKQTGPFALKTVSAKASLNGLYLAACHAGAAIEGLCLGGTNASGGASSFYLNSTDYGYGSLVWNLPLGNAGGEQYVSEPLSLQYDLGSNVAVPLFQPSDVSVPLGFTDKDELYLYSAFDDSKARATATVPSDVYTARDLQNWYACYAVVGGYYYQAIAWVTAGAPHNPTCEPVKVIKVDA